MKFIYLKTIMVQSWTISFNEIKMHILAGQTPLHQAIVNEDAAMVRFLLRHGADIHARCYGSFFCPDDQRATRTDSLEHEAVDVNPKTNYPG